MVEIRATKDGIPVENRIHVNCFHDPTAADLAAIANAVAVVVNNDWRDALPSDLNLREVFVRSLQTQNGITHTLAFGQPAPGLFTGEPLPNEVSFCAKLTSLFSGRSARGRLYWMGLSIDQVAGNFVIAANANNIQAGLRNMRDAIAALGFAWVIVSYRSNNAPRVGGPVYFIVQDAVFVDTKVDSQRGRMH